MIKARALPILYQTICASFCVILVVSNILSAKMIELPLVMLRIPAGLVTYPLTFLLSDLVTEIFGVRRAKQMVYIALGMSLLSFCIIQIGLLLPAYGAEEQRSFQTVLGLSSLRIFSSLVSYISAQIIGIRLYAAIRYWSGSRFLWLRNSGSICISQIVDTVTLDLIFLWGGLGMAMSEVLSIMLFSYLYKVFFGIVCTPLFYLFVFLIRGREQKTWVQTKPFLFAR
jgi:uncharacterized integral membrane protein (TIGR00697 family)